MAVKVAAGKSLNDRNDTIPYLVGDHKLTRGAAMSSPSHLDRPSQHWHRVDVRVTYSTQNRECER